MPRAEEAEVKRKRLRSIVEPAGFGWRHWRWHVAVNSLGNIINIYTNDGMISHGPGPRSPCLSIV